MVNVNPQPAYSYNPLQQSEQPQEDTWDTLSLPDEDQRAQHKSSYLSAFMISFPAIVRQKRYRNLLIGSCCFTLVYLLWPSSSPDSFLPWHNEVSEDDWLGRSEQVKGAFLHAYDSYEKHAWGYDELMPATKGRTNKQVVTLISHP